MKRRLPLPNGEPRDGSDRHRTAVCGWNRCVLASSVDGLICRNALTSRTHRLRPCVAATISPAVGWTAISWIATVGRLLLIFAHDSPRLIEAQAANSVPR